MDIIETELIYNTDYKNHQCSYQDLRYQIGSINQDVNNDNLRVKNIMGVLHFLLSLPVFQDLY